jgi:ERCC4-type nuclease
MGVSGCHFVAVSPWRRWHGLCVLEIVADVHEQPSRIPALLETLGARVTIRALTRGDYVAGPQCVVERKTVVDLHLTVLQGRFWHQIRKLRAAGRRPYLLIEGPSLWPASRRLAPNAVRGLLLAVGDLGVSVIRSESREDTAAWIVRLANRCQTVEISDRPVYSQRPQRRSSIDPTEQAGAAAPGISTVTARSLLAQFGSLQAIASATVEELQTVAGVGQHRAEALHSMIHSEWNADQAH